MDRRKIHPADISSALGHRLRRMASAKSVSGGSDGLKRNLLSSS